MNKKKLFGATALFIFGLLVMSCEKDAPVAISPVNNTTDITKSTVTTFKFAANGKDCGIADGYANQQHILPKLVHLNTDKCNGENFRPTITLNFGEAPVPGTYTVVAENPSVKQFTITSDEYNYTSWTGTSGTVTVTTNSEDTTKVDIEFNSITMNNKKNTTDTLNPATDTLTGFIIKI